MLPFSEHECNADISNPPEVPDNQATSTRNTIIPIVAARDSVKNHPKDLGSLVSSRLVPLILPQLISKLDLNDVQVSQPKLLPIAPNSGLVNGFKLLKSSGSLERIRDIGTSIKAAYRSVIPRSLSKESIDDAVDRVAFLQSKSGLSVTELADYDSRDGDFDQDAVDVVRLLQAKIQGH